MKILQLNMHRSKVADALLSQIMMEEAADIAIICEQYCRKSGQWIEDENTTAAIWIPPASSYVADRSGKGDCFAWARIGEVNIVSCYLTPSDNIADFEGKLSNIEDFVRTSQGHSIVAGDVNARAVDWGMQSTDARGRRIVEMMARSGLIAVNKGNTPTFRRPGCEGTIPDVTLVTERAWCKITEWKVLETYTASDHQYISYNYGTHARRYENTGRGNLTTRKWNSRKLNSEMLSTEIERMPNATPDNNASQTSKLLIEAIQQICDKVMPRISTNTQRRKAVHWWNQDIANARRECFKCRRKLTRARRRGEALEERDSYREAKKKLQDKIFKSKQKLWEELCEDINSNPWGTGYKLVMGKLRSGNPTVMMNDEQMTRIVKELFPTHENREGDSALAEDTRIPLFTTSELMAAASTLKPGKAPGPDGIPSEVLQAIAHKRPELLLDTFNKCLLEGRFPKIWKVQRLVLISKGKGDPATPSAYRPLCMLDTAGKLLERLIKPRLMEAIERSGGLSERQHGFRPGRSTIGALSDVINCFEGAQQRNHYSRPVILLATLDVKNAFNSLRWKDVLRTLETPFQVPVYLRRIIGDYLSDRELIYNTSDGLRNYRITSGAAQGSILGPDLWNITYDGILRMEMPQDTFLVGYADDLAAVISARDTEDAQRKLRQVMIRTESWIHSHGLCLAKEKTGVLLLTRRHMPIEISLSFDDTIIHTQRCVNYLGIRLDPKLTFSEHIRHVATKAAKIVAQLGQLMANVRGPTQGKRRLLMETSSSILLYGCEVWGEAMRWKRKVKTLLVVQRTAALRITSAYRTVSAAAVVVIAGTIPIDLKIQERKKIWTKKQTNTLEQGEDERIRLDTLRAWQARWTSETRGRWTARLIPCLETWIGRTTGEVNYYLTQALSGHGYFRQYLHRMGKCSTPYCIYEQEDQIDDAEHTFFRCTRWTQRRIELEGNIG